MTRRKWLIAALTWMAAWGWTSCSSDDENLQEDTRDVKVNFTVAEKQGFDPSSKAVKTGWAAGDQIRVFFTPTGGSLIYTANSTAGTLLLTYNGSTWTESGLTAADITNLGTSGTFAAVHYRVASGKTIGVGTMSSGGSLALYNYDAGNVYNGGEVLLHKGNYTVSDGTVNLGTLTMKLGSENFCQISIPKSKVTGLAAGWKLAVLKDSYTSGTPNDHTTKIEGFEKPTFNTENDIIGYEVSSKPYYATGVENEDDISFVFSKWGTIDTNEYVFYLTNGTDVYTLRVDRGYDAGTDTYQKTFEKGKAYRLTSGTWTKQ